MSKLFRKEQILTIPNLLSFLRLAMIPAILWAYCKAHNTLLTIGLVVLSGLTDVADGIIARKFDMVSDFGKALDPLADKLTQGALLLCLCSRHRQMIPLVVLFAVKELLMLVMGAVLLRRTDAVNSSQWHGKAVTVLLYSVCGLLILFPGLPQAAVTALTCLCAAAIFISFCLYARFYLPLLQRED